MRRATLSAFWDSYHPRPEDLCIKSGSVEAEADHATDTASRVTPSEGPP